MCRAHSHKPRTPSASSTPRAPGIRPLLAVSFICLVACVRGDVALLDKSYNVNRGAVSLSAVGGATRFFPSDLPDLYARDALFSDSPKHAVDEMVATQVDSVALPRLAGLSESEFDLRVASPRHEDSDDDDDEHDHHHHHDEGLTWQRSLHVVGAALAITLVSLLGILLPSLLGHLGASRSVSTRALVETLCTAFAAGGFWGLALVHMLLEAITALQTAQTGFFLGEARNFFNAAYILAVTGYIIMLGVQNFAVVLNSKAHKRATAATVDYDASSGGSLAILDALVSTLALTFHAFFEGLVCGMRDDATLIWVATVSVIGHKWAESFSLAQSMRARAVPRLYQLIFLGIFLAASPVGALVGLPLGALGNEKLVGILNSLSAGILIFVAGHCTEDVFGGHCHDHSLVMTCDHHHGQDRRHTHAEDAHGQEAHDEESHTKDAEKSAARDADTPSVLENTPTHDTKCPGYHPVFVQASQEREEHTHGHGPAHCSSEPDFTGSVRVFLGRMVAVVAGTTLVVGMMAVHMTNSAHSHAV